MPPPPRGHVPLYIGGFADKALERVAKYGDGYFGNAEVCDQYVGKLRAQGKDPEIARIRVPELFLAVAKDPEKAMHELARHYHHVNNSYAKWLSEDKLEGPSLEPMTLERFEASGTLQILTPSQAIDKFKAMQSRMPLEHVMMMMPPGLPSAKFVEYAEVFAKEVIPAFQ